jgi:hypothetical protein
MRTAEWQCKRHVAIDLPPKFRIPHSAFRIASFLPFQMKNRAATGINCGCRTSA